MAIAAPCWHDVHAGTAEVGPHLSSVDVAFLSSLHAKPQSRDIKIAIDHSGPPLDWRISSPRYMGFRNLRNNGSRHRDLSHSIDRSLSFSGVAGSSSFPGRSKESQDGPVRSPSEPRYHRGSGSCIAQYFQIGGRVYSGRHSACKSPASDTIWLQLIVTAHRPHRSSSVLPPIIEVSWSFPRQGNRFVRCVSCLSWRYSR